MTEWEGSPSSEDQDTDNQYPQSYQIKYIPINYFEYFDNANLDSDEFTSSSLLASQHPPVLPVDSMRCSTRQMVQTCLYIVSCMISQADIAVPRIQSALLQLGVVACNQLKVIHSCYSLIVKFNSLCQSLIQILTKNYLCCTVHLTVHTLSY